MEAAVEVLRARGARAEAETAASAELRLRSSGGADQHREEDCGEQPAVPAFHRASLHFQLTFQLSTHFRLSNVLFNFQTYFSTFELFHFFHFTRRLCDRRHGLPRAPSRGCASS